MRQFWASQAGLGCFVLWWRRILVKADRADNSSTRCEEWLITRKRRTFGARCYVSHSNKWIFSERWKTCIQWVEKWSYLTSPGNVKFLLKACYVRKKDEQWFQKIKVTLVWGKTSSVKETNDSRPDPLSVLLLEFCIAYSFGGKGAGLMFEEISFGS